MKDETPEVRVLSATALGRVAPGDEKAIETLGLAVTGDPDVNVQSAAASGLGWMGPQAAAAGPVLIRALNDRDETVRVHVILAHGRIGPADGSFATVLKTIAEQDPSADFRIWATRALGLIGAKSKLVVPTLLKMLDDANVDIRNAAAYTLGKIRPTSEVLPALLGKLNDRKPSERSLAACTLGMLGPEVAAEALPALDSGIRDDDIDVREGASPRSWSSEKPPRPPPPPFARPSTTGARRSEAMPNWPSSASPAKPVSVSSDTDRGNRCDTVRWLNRNA